MWTTGIAPLCSSGFVIDRNICDQVMPQFELCCVFTWQLSSLSELVGVTDPKQSLCFCCCFYQLGLLFTLAFFRARHLAIRLLTFSCLFFFRLLFRQKQVMFYCLLCIMALCTHFILMFAVIFIFTLSTELQMSLSLSFSGCECRERTWTRFQWICQIFINKHTRNNSECYFI